MTRMNHDQAVFRPWIYATLLLLLVPLLAACAGFWEQEPQADAPDTTTPAQQNVPEPDEEEEAAENDSADTAAPDDEAPAAEDSGRSDAEKSGAAGAVVPTAPAAPAAPYSPAPTPPPASGALGIDSATDEEMAEAEEFAEAAPAPPAADGSSSDAAPVSPPEPDSEPSTSRGFQGAPAPLKAGEVDDNAQFQTYLDYLATYQPEIDGTVRTADISERYIIRVLDDDQRPLLDAAVRIYDEQGQLLFEGRTYAGGETLFLPRVRDVSDNVQQFRVVAEQGNNQAEATLERGTQQRLELAIADAQSPAELRLDVLFLLDTTGSMADELSRIQETIDSIAQRIDAFQPRPELRFGLVAYRDEGDDYVTREYDFTPDVGAFREVLRSFDADGGGDTPEALDEGLHTAIHTLQWSEDAVRLIFLVADAGPHIDRQLGYTYLTDAQQAVERGIKIYSIAASNTNPRAEYVFRQLAQQTMGRFIFLTYQAGESSGAPGETTTLQAGEQEFTVERLDDLIVQVIERELAAAVGAQ